MPSPTTNALFVGPTTVASGGTTTNFTITPFPVPITGTYTLTDGGYGGTFTPPSLSWVSDNTPKTFVWNAPAIPGIAVITPVYGGGTAITAPTSINVTVTGANPPQHLYQFPMVGGVPPFQILATNDQIPGAAIPRVIVAQHLYYYPMVSLLPPFGILITNNQIPAAITPPVVPATTTSRGTFEAGTGTIAGLAVGDMAILMGPWQTPFRISMKEVVSVQATGSFNLDYQFSTDNGTTWYQGNQVASTASFADGTAYANRAHMKIEPGWFWRIQITNTAAVAIDAAYEKRFTERGQWGT